ncbi:MAG TPA: FliH/SctL family protein [Xanthobacteraceae bacterium]|nr:FliH/SctL family protein [Xanthobacteraceae bacterium]
MTAPSKFMFDNDFGDGPRKPTEPMITVAEHAAKLAEAETAGHKRGHAQGHNDAQVEINRRIAATLETIAKSIAAASAALQAIEARLECEAVEVAVAVARKLAPTLIAREPFAEISALASDCFRQLITAPHIVVRVNDAVYATAKEKLEDIARGCSFEGRLVVLAEPDIAAGDCRIEWADGGINRDNAGADAAITEAVAGYVGARRSAAGPAPEMRRSPLQSRPAPVVTAEAQETREQHEPPEQHVAPPSVPDQPELPLPRGHELLMPSDDEFRRL